MQRLGNDVRRIGIVDPENHLAVPLPGRFSYADHIAVIGGQVDARIFTVIFGMGFDGLDPVEGQVE